MGVVSKVKDYKNIQNFFQLNTMEYQKQFLENVKKFLNYL